MKKLLGMGIAAGVAAAGLAVLPVPAGAAQVLGNVGVEISPLGSAISPDSRYAYVSNNASGSVSVIDLNSNSLVTNINTGGNPAGISFTPDGTRAYTANAAGSLVIINTATRSVAQSLAIPGSPAGTAVTPDGKYVLVTRELANKVSVVSVATGAQVAEVSVGADPTAVAVSSDGTRAYVTNRGSNSVSVINIASGGSFTAAPVAIAVGAGPVWVATSPTLPSRAYVTNFFGNTMSVIDGTSVIGTVPGLLSPTGVAVSADGATVYANNFANSTLAAINPATFSVTSTTPVGANPRGVAISADGSRAVTADFLANTATILAMAPRVATQTATGVKGTSATGKGQVNADAESVTSVRCFYGTDASAVAKGPNGSATSVLATPSTVAAGQTTVVSCPFSGLARGTTYYYVVAAQDIDGYGWQQPQSFTTRPAKPGSLTVVAKRKALVVTWAAVPSATYYQSRIRKGSSWSAWRQVTQTKIRHGKLQRKTRYQVQVRAGNDAGTGPKRSQKARTR